MTTLADLESKLVEIKENSLPRSATDEDKKWCAAEIKRIEKEIAALAPAKK